MNEADPRVKRTRKLLMDAFVALLGEKSFKSISVQDVAARATLNRATFYAHFEDKYALMDHVFRETFREAMEKHVPATAPCTLANLHLLVATVCDFFDQFQGHCSPPDHDLNPMIEAKVQQELYAFLLDWLGQSPAEASSVARREKAALVMSWAIFGAGVEWSRGEHTISSDDWVRQILAVIVGGVSDVLTVPTQAHRSQHNGTASAAVPNR